MYCIDINSYYIEQGRKWGFDNSLGPGFFESGPFAHNTKLIMRKKFKDLE
tara:strand:- start:652 stop:801 length:150 start_codon:yes stop_codon:yes gene_type:complete